MLGWLKKRERQEHLKLVKQNELSEQYLHEFAVNSIESGMGGDPSLVETLLHALRNSQRLAEYLAENRTLTTEMATEQLAINRNLRRLYDEVLAGKQAFATSFGSASEPLLPYDKKFVPNEGWKVFYAHREL